MWAPLCDIYSPNAEKTNVEHITRETKEDIVNELIKQGLTAEEIQEAYERYVWHYNYYEPKLQTVEKELKAYKDRYGELEGKCV